MPLDLSELATRVPRPDDDAREAARARLAALAPPGAFGRFGELVEWLAGVQGQCPTRRLDRIRLVAMAGAPAGRRGDLPAPAGQPGHPSPRGSDSWWRCRLR